jgi:TRAP-type C4-dicarboxylate transport system substrate-binding protein
LRVSSGRLVTNHAIRGETFYSELSHGERAKMALSIATEAVGPDGLIVARQKFWEGLDPANRQIVHEAMREAGVYGLTAEADLGELRAEVA